MHFLIVIYTACKSLAKWWGLFLGTSHFDWGGGQKYPHVGICGGRIAPWNYKYLFKKIASLSILDGFERSIHLLIGNDVYNFTNIYSLNFHVNMPPSWILCVFGPFYKYIFPPRVHHCTTYVIYSEAAYSAEETIY